MPALLDAADHERGLLQVSTTLVAAQLALLAWLVLFQIVTDSAESRGNEVALAKLRGFRGRSTLAFGLGQPVAVLAVAVPVGLLLAWAAVAAMSRWVLVPGTPVQMTWAAVLGALVGFTGAVVGAALAARRVLTRPVLEQWRQGAGRAARRRLARPGRASCSSARSPVWSPCAPAGPRAPPPARSA